MMFIKTFLAQFCCFIDKRIYLEQMVERTETINDDVHIALNISRENPLPPPYDSQFCELPVSRENPLFPRVIHNYVNHP